MQRTSKSTRGTSRAKSGALKIVVVYDGFADLIRAYEMWSRVAARLENEIPIVSSAWNFDLLRDPRLRKKAIVNTADADLVVVSTSGRSELPDHMQNWIRAWMPWKKGRRDALVAVLDPQTPRSNAANRFRNYLHQMAEQTGMDFFCSSGERHRPSQAAAGA